MENGKKAQTQIEKLNILLPHWINHNNDHIRDQENWIKKAEAAGLLQVADELRRALDYSKKANRYIEQADLCLKNKKVETVKVAARNCFCLCKDLSIFSRYENFLFYPLQYLPQRVTSG